MFLLIGIFIQYIVTIIVVVLVLWFSMVELVYQNKQCSTIHVDKYNYSKANSSIIDPRLKLNHFTVLGTHNSYHRPNLIANYGHPNLDKQLETKVRQIELDLHLMKDNHLVYHLQVFDDKTNCYCLKECLIKIGNWSLNNPTHYPVYLFFEIKQMFYEDFVTGITGVKCEHFQEMKKQILNVFSLDKFILPNEIQGNKKSIKDALQTQRDDELSENYSYRNFGWPPVYRSLGKLIPVFIDDVYNLAVDMYSKCDPLRSFFFIAQTNSDLSYSSIISISNTIKNEQLLNNIQSNGQLLRLLIGYGNDQSYQIYQRAQKYGIHIISSDSLQCNDTQLCQTLQSHFLNSTVLCNNSTAPTFCNSSTILI
jgi:hypothetical protein